MDFIKNFLSDKSKLNPCFLLFIALIQLYLSFGFGGGSYYEFKEEYPLRSPRALASNSYYYFVVVSWVGIATWLHVKT